VDVERAVREAWSATDHGATTPRHELETRIARDARWLSVDPLALRQILTNLFDNAVRHTPPGGRITVEASATSRDFTLTVRDTGSGIPSEYLSRIFERFYRVDPARSREHGGTGLGLAIVKHLVEAHGGRVEAESTLGRGTTIRMTFPLTA
jgi:signal transduction histidine kinase